MGPDLIKHKSHRNTLLLNAMVNSLKIQEPSQHTATIAPGMSAIVDEPGVKDSGANISITNPTVVSKFNLQPQRWDQPFHIKFGNGSCYFCTHFAYFGPILGRIAIVDAAPDTLISMPFSLPEASKYASWQMVKE